MQTTVLLHLIMALAAFKPNQLHVSLDLFCELPKDPFILSREENPSMLLREEVQAAPF